MNHHNTIVIPGDVPLIDLARALASIGLHVAHGYHPSPTFIRGQAAVAPPSLCAKDGCERLATTKDGGAAICAKHWMEHRGGV